MSDSVRGEARRRRIGRRDRLRPRGLECDGEGMLARVGGGERVARRQDGVRVAAGQGHRAGVAGRHVAIRVVGGDRPRYRPSPPCRLAGKPVTVKRLGGRGLHR